MYQGSLCLNINNCGILRDMCTVTFLKLTFETQMFIYFILQATTISQYCLNMFVIYPFRQDLVVPLPNGIHVHPKLVLITDGYPTETCLYRGPDSTDERTDSLVSVLLLDVK